MELKEETKNKFTNMGLKDKLSEHQLAVLQSEFEKRKKSKIFGYLLWFFFGTVGVHRIYTANYWMAFFMFITVGGCGIWMLIDGFFFYWKKIDRMNEEIEAEIIQVLLDMDPSHKVEDEPIDVEIKDDK